MVALLKYVSDFTADVFFARKEALTLVALLKCVSDFTADVFFARKEGF